MILARVFEWEMGHRLLSSSGHCRFPHGHSFSARVFIEGQPDARNGMILDLSELSKSIEPLFEKLDHAFLIHEKDPLFDQSFKNGDLKENGVIKVPFEPTVENIAHFLFKEVRKKCALVIKIEVHETRKNSAVCEGDLNEKA